MQAVILAAGSGTRLRPITDNMSKPMIPVANKPIIGWTIEALSAVCEDVIVVVRPQQQDIINYLQEFPMCRVVFQTEPLGTAHAALQAESLIEDRFLLINGDEIIQRDDIRKFAGQECLSIACARTDPRRFAAIYVESGRVKRIEEKPAEPKTDLASSGMYLLDRRIFDAIKRTGRSRRGEYEITDSLGMLIADGAEIMPFVLSKWMTITYPWHILDANMHMLDQLGSLIGKDVEIRSGSYIEHPVAIGEGSVIGPNCFIRKYSVIGRNCRVGNAVEIKNSIIMDNTFVSHLSYVGDSIVGRNCNIAAGTIFANLRLDDKSVGMKLDGNIIDSGRRKLGGIVADNVKFGVNCVVMPGKKIYPGIIVPPCKIVDSDIEEQPELKNSRSDANGRHD